MILPSLSSLSSFLLLGAMAYTPSLFIITAQKFHRYARNKILHIKESYTHFGQAKREILQHEPHWEDMGMTKEQFKKDIDSTYNTIMKKVEQKNPALTASIVSTITGGSSLISPYFSSHSLRHLREMTAHFEPQPAFVNVPGTSCAVVEVANKKAIRVDEFKLRKCKAAPEWQPILAHEQSHLISDDIPLIYLNKLRVLKPVLELIERGSFEKFKRLYQTQEIKADLHAYSDPKVGLRHMIAMRDYIDRTQATDDIAHPPREKRVAYLNKLIEAKKKDIGYHPIEELD